MPGCVKRRECFIVELNSKNLREFFDTKRPNGHYKTLEESLCIFSFLRRRYLEVCGRMFRPTSLASHPRPSEYSRESCDADFISLADNGGFLLYRACAPHTSRTTASRGSIWKQPHTKFLDHPVGLCAHLLYACLFSCLTSITFPSPLYSCPHVSCTSPTRSPRTTVSFPHKSKHADPLFCTPHVLNPLYLSHLFSLGRPVSPC